jgi:putative transposase
MTAMRCGSSFSNAGPSRSFPTIRLAKRRHPFDETAYPQRNLIERMFCRLKDWRRIATRYDKLAATFAAAVMLAAIIIWWT